MTQTPDPGVEPNEPEETGAGKVAEEPTGPAPAESPETAAGTEPGPEDAEGHEDAEPDPLAAAQAELAERTEDLQRLQAEYVNYRKRVERDRDVARTQGVESVVRSLLPVFDAIVQAEAHGELTGGFKLVADELVKVTTGHGLSSFGAPGEEFDPRRHEALMQVPVPGDGEMTIHEVMQRGFELNGAIVRPARVVVAVPNGEESTENAGQDAGEADGSDEPAGD